jgi:hypothetical protein
VNDDDITTAIQQYVKQKYATEYPEETHPIFLRDWVLVAGLSSPNEHASLVYVCRAPETTNYAAEGLIAIAERTQQSDTTEE